ncbi:Glycosyltransferase [Forsythia ovata]|uniref:Glycosyltransferase n=1 Tax=Forsythia ovata TaxID=205694 RepID=A0ABD1SIL5_9LAMI
MRQVTNGYLETILDWVPGTKDIRLRDIPSFIRTIDSNDIMLNFVLSEVEAVPKAKALILNTFDALEPDVLNAISWSLVILAADVPACWKMVAIKELKYPIHTPYLFPQIPVLVCERR